MGSRNIHRIRKENLAAFRNREENVKAKFKLPSYSLSSQKYGDYNGHEPAYFCPQIT